MKILSNIQLLSRHFSSFVRVGLPAAVLVSLCGVASAGGATILRVSSPSGQANYTAGKQAPWHGDKDLWSQRCASVSGIAQIDKRPFLSFAGGHFTILYGAYANQGRWTSFVRFQTDGQTGLFHRWVDGNYVGATAGSPLVVVSIFPYRMEANGAQNLSASDDTIPEQYRLIQLLGRNCDLWITPIVSHQYGSVWTTGAANSRTIRGHVGSFTYFAIRLESSYTFSLVYHEGNLGAATATGVLTARSMGFVPDSPTRAVVMGDVDADFDEALLSIGVRKACKPSCLWFLCTACADAYDFYVDRRQAASVLDL